MTISLTSDDKTFEQIKKQLNRSVEVIKVIDFTDTDYSNYLGFTWERELVGLTPVGYDADDEDFDTIGATGGEKTHTLTIDEMPEHGFTISTTNSSSTYTDGYIMTGGYIKTHDVNLGSIGGGQPHNNLPPYKVVAYWKRTA